MAAQKPRRFNMGDLMILIAAVALGAAAARVVWPLTAEALERYRATSDLRPLEILLPIVLSSVLLLPATFGVFVMRLRPPRPRRARLILQPGMAAACAVGIVCAFQSLVTAVTFARHAYGPGPRGISYSPSILLGGFRWSFVHFSPELWFGSRHFPMFAANLTFACGLAVAVVWIILWLSGLWRGERSWIDRLGRVLGMLWIAISAIVSIP